MKRKYMKPEMTAYIMDMAEPLMQASKTVGIVNDDADPNIDVLSLDDEDDEGLQVFE